MAFVRFDAPGFVKDLGGAELQAWSDWVSQQIDQARARDGTDEGLVNYGPRPQFFNPLRADPGPDAVEKDITWTAFPRIVKLMSVSDVQRWRRADSGRDVQDEYCEWSVTRDPHTQKILRVTFTSEGPEYWQYLAATAPQKVLELYRQHIDPRVEMRELFGPGGGYNLRNRWNSSTEGGALHLIQRNNTLGAEIELAAAATLVRRRDGRILTTEQELIECGAYGQAERFSDPHIGAEVNALAREKAEITLANPVGLCIAGLSVAGWTTPDGSSPLDGCWTITQGTPEKALRAVYEVPAGRGFVAGDVRINGRNIEFGSQIADFITIKLTGLATRFGTGTPPPLGCVDRASLEAAPGVPSVESVLSGRPAASRL